MRGTFSIAALIAVGGLGGCISTGGETPEWFQQRSAEQDASYPRLREVPRGSTADTNTTRWSAVEAELVAAGQAVKAHPRAQPAAPAQDPAAFLDEARRELDETRASHEPN